MEMRGQIQKQSVGGRMMRPGLKGDPYVSDLGGDDQDQDH